MNFFARLLGIKQPEDENRKTLNILHRAYNRAKDILVSAELSGIKIRAESKIEAKKATEEFARGAQSQLSLFLSEIKDQSKAEMTQFNKNFEKEMASIMDFELAELRKSLASYKAERIRELDASFTAVAQKAIEDILKKKISLADQTDMVYEALEKAKQEKLIT